MKKIPVWFNNRIVDYAFVDNEDYDKVKQYKWWADMNYAKTNQINGSIIYLHVFIMGKAPKGYIIGHSNGKGLDCQKKNLQFVTIAQNAQNHGGFGNKYGRGISFRKDGNRTKRWRGTVVVLGKIFCTKDQATQKEAMYARDELTRKYHGMHGRYHFPRVGERGMDGQVRTH